MDSEEEIITLRMKKKKKSVTPPPRRFVKIVIPRRNPSVAVPPRKIVYPSPDKTTCAECPCFPKEEPYRKPKRLLSCQQSPRTLYELAAEAVNKLKFPAAFGWSIEDVANWMDETVGLPQYRACILDNHINGLRLLMLEDPSILPEMNIHYFEHIKMITSKVREVYSTEFVKFARSIGLPPRKPLTHSTWFKSRTGPIWGIRENWTRSEVLRWMKIIMPEPLKLDHWDLVWYRNPEFPKVLFARVQEPESKKREVEPIPVFPSRKEICREFMVPRKFRLQSDIAESKQFIWMEHRRGKSWRKMKREEEERKRRQEALTKFVIKEDSRLIPKKVTTEGLRGKQLILARRLMPRPKFLIKV